MVIVVVVVAAAAGQIRGRDGGICVVYLASVLCSASIVLVEEPGGQVIILQVEWSRGWEKAPGISRLLATMGLSH